MYLPSGSSKDIVIPVPQGGVALVPYTLTDHTGTVMVSGNAPVVSGTATITIPGSYNTLTAVPSWQRRTVRWSYSSGGKTIVGREAYRVELGVEHDATFDLVRALLGVDADELADSVIDLTAAYFSFRSLVDTDAFDEAVLGTGDTPILLARAIAANAALDHLGALQLRVAVKESSGTNSYERGKVDWESLRMVLLSIIASGVGALSNDATGGTLSIFTIGTRTDAITGAAAE